MKYKLSLVFDKAKKKTLLKPKNLYVRKNPDKSQNMLNLLNNQNIKS